MTYIGSFVVLIHLFSGEHRVWEAGLKSIFVLFLEEYFSRRVFQDQLGHSGSAAANDFTSAQCVIAIYEHRHCEAAAPLSREIGG